MHGGAAYMWGGAASKYFRCKKEVPNRAFTQARKEARSRSATARSAASARRRAPGERPFRVLSRWRERAGDLQRSRSRSAEPILRRQGAELAIAEYCRLLFP